MFSLRLRLGLEVGGDEELDGAFARDSCARPHNVRSGVTWLVSPQRWNSPGFQDEVDFSLRKLPINFVEQKRRRRPLAE